MLSLLLRLLILPSIISMEYNKVETGKLHGTWDFVKYAVTDKGQPVTVATWAQVTRQWPMELNNVFKSVPYDAFFWEVKPVRDMKAAQEQAMEFVVVDAPRLHQFARGKPNAQAFAEHFNEEATVVFNSLGGDSRLAAPTPRSSNHTAYTDLGIFAREGLLEQQSGLWKRVAHEFLIRLTTHKDVWLSTSGTGVAWLHVRLDSRPKYYTYTEYKDIESSARVDL